MPVLMSSTARRQHCFTCNTQINEHDENLVRKFIRVLARSAKFSLENQCWRGIDVYRVSVSLAVSCDNGYRQRHRQKLHANVSIPP
jgi:hypothetical protein